MTALNRYIYRFVYAVLPLLAALCLTACVNESEGSCPEPAPMPAPGSDGASFMTFRLVSPRARAKATSRAPSRAIPDTDNTLYWGDDYTSETGTDFDNALLKNSFAVYITRADGTPITKLRDLLCTKTTVAGGSVIYSFSGEIPADDATVLKSIADARIHVVANCGDAPTLSAALDFSRAGKPSASFTAIPMWGVRGFDFTTLKPGKNDAGDIWLLRAMAKVEISITDDPTNYITALNSASVAGVNQNGYLLPEGWNTVADTKSLSYEKSLNPLAPTGNLTGLTAEDNKIVFYLPETDNSSGNAAITLTYTASGRTRRGTIRFARYLNGALPSGSPNYDIVRNHLYRYDVYLGATSDNFSITYTVCPWNDYTITPPTFD